MGVEYVTGENEFYANFYKPLGHTTSSYSLTTRDDMIPAPYNVLDTGVNVGEGHENVLPLDMISAMHELSKMPVICEPISTSYHWNRMSGEIRDIEWFNNDNYNIKIPL